MMDMNEAPAPGWYPVTRQVRRWWDGHAWGEDALQGKRRTTVTALRRFIRIVQWSWIGLGIVCLAFALGMSVVYGSSTAFVLAPMALLGVVAIVAVSIVATRQLASLPVTASGPSGAA